MWIIPKTMSDTYPYVQGTVELISDSDEFCQLAEQSLIVKSKHTQSKTWLKRLKQVKWMKHLFGRTLKPSHFKSFTDVWTSSLVASPVNRFQMQELKEVLEMNDTSTPLSQKASNNADHQYSFLKTWKDCSRPTQKKTKWFCTMSSKTWNQWVTQLQQEYSLRKKSVSHTKDEESLSWATPNTLDYMAERSAEAMERQFATHRKGRTRPSNLREQINFPTPTVAGLVEGGVAAEVKLTPTGFKAVRENGTEYGAKLRDAVLTYQTFPTPVAHEGRLGYQDRKNGKKGTQESLTTVVVNIHQDPQSHKKIGKKRESLGVLNPNWVEQLMGLKVGWTQIKTE